MRVQLTITIVIICSVLSSCKTITIDEESPQEIPDGVELIKIPAGAFTYSESKTVEFIEYDYEMMKFQVTNEQYLNFIKEAVALNLVKVDTNGVYGHYIGDKFWPPGNYKYINFSSNIARIGFYPPDFFYTKWRYVENRIEYYSDHPVTHVTWFGAMAFATYYGMRLPTEMEWEKAARANTGSNYPWGNDFLLNYANYKNSSDPYDNDTTPVGYYNGSGDTNNSCSPYGIYDMAGNVWEWTASWSNDNSGKTIKGGSWNSPITSQEGSDELHSLTLSCWFEPAVGYLPTNTSREIGFRCIRYTVD